MFIQNVDSVYEIEWTEGVKYGDLYRENERQWSIYNFEEADTEMLFNLFNMFEAESSRLVEKGLVLPAYDYCLKCSHVFNLLDARGAISVAERQAFIARVRRLAGKCAKKYLEMKEGKGEGERVSS
jgi:glycyl-tRNA synthetase alpha chain